MMNYEQSDLYNAIYAEVISEVASPKERIEDTADSITEKLMQVFKDFELY